MFKQFAVFITVLHLVVNFSHSAFSCFLFDLGCSEGTGTVGSAREDQRKGLWETEDLFSRSGKMPFCET